jgi:hypothetical protein
MNKGKAADIAFKLYQLPRLEAEERNSVLTEAVDFWSKNGTIGWVAQREKYLPILLKVLQGTDLAEQEKLLLAEADSLFTVIQNRAILDLCFMFWRLTGNTKYYDIICHNASSKSSHVYLEANILLKYFG